MANLCDYMMKIKGRREDINELIELMKADLNYHNEQTDKNKRIECVGVLSVDKVNDSIYVATIDGNCSCSVDTSMIEEGNHTTLPVQSKILNLVIEIYSLETGIGFMEYYLIENGIIKSKKCVDYEEYSIEGFETKYEAEEDLGVQFTDKEWTHANHEEGYITRGGMEWDFII